MLSESSSEASGSSPLHGRRVVVALSGGIACYKTATLVSRLVQRGVEVRVVMTQAATRFIGPLTLQSLSGREVVTSVWEHVGEGVESPHIELARWANAMMIAPASADLLAKLAHGLCDDPVSLVTSALPRDEAGALRTPLLIAPAMNADMWANPIVQQNVATVRDVLGAELIGPEEGWQACRTKGAGRMSEPEAILERVETSLLTRR